jgi:hypothetical protein
MMPRPNCFSLYLLPVLLAAPYRLEAQIAVTNPNVRPRLVWDQPFDPLSPGEKVTYQIKRTFGPRGLVLAGFSAGIDQWQGDPEEWQQGLRGYGERYASRMGTRVTRRGIRTGIGILRGEDERFFRSGQTGFWRRTKNVLLQTVRVRTDDGGTTVPIGRWAGAFGGSWAASAWEPASRSGFRNGLERGAGVLAGDVSLQFLREFWPDIRRTVFRRKD